MNQQKKNDKDIKKVTPSEEAELTQKPENQQEAEKQSRDTFPGMVGMLLEKLRWS